MYNVYFKNVLYKMYTVPFQKCSVEYFFWCPTALRWLCHSVCKGWWILHDPGATAGCSSLRIEAGSFRRLSLAWLQILTHRHHQEISGHFRKCGQPRCTEYKAPNVHCTFFNVHCTLLSSRKFWTDAMHRPTPSAFSQVL